jgi:ubiquinone/menaquinone biosynthesis C-methylase UbiE
LEKDERQVAEWYNTLSGSYDELYGREQSSKHKTILEFLGNRHFRVLLDIGCGTGSFLEKANEICDHSVGIDLSANMLRIAKNRRIPNSDLVLASSSSLPFKDESSDCTVSISTATAESNLPRFIADVERVARGDYLLAITLFQQSGTIDAVTLPHVVGSTKISERETLYFLRPAHRHGMADD